MSKPNLLGFASSVGIYRNKRIRDLRVEVGKTVHKKVDFRELAPMLFQVVMAYAAENQIDGNFAGYTTDAWVEVFAANHVHIEDKEAAAIVRAFHQVGLFDGDKIRSWAKFNRHLADYEGILRAKQKAAKIMHKKREQEAKESLKNHQISASETVEKPLKNDAKTRSKNGAENDSPTKQLWLLDKALESAKGPARKQLLAQKKALLAESTGVDLSDPAPPPAQPAARPRVQPPGEFKRTALKNARLLVESGSPELLTEAMAKALLDAGDELPAEVRSKFPKLAERNPVPG